MSADAPGGGIAINTAALAPLFKPWEEPHRHRVRAPDGGPPQIKTYRRGSPVQLVNRLRGKVKEWRDSNYCGASDTTRELLTYWFERPHRIETNDGEIDFRYYFCQREAVETFIFLMEVMELRSLASLIEVYGGPDAETEAAGIAPEEDQWARYAFKLATGAGKTKCMSLAVVWSYFHALRESHSDMAKHFVIIAPNLTVFERLKEDFRPEGGGPDIFTSDPLIPPEWKGDWNFSVVLQDEPGGAAAGGVLYLTNIHRLYPKKKSKEEETYGWAGPSVSKANALDTAAELRKRIASHDRIMLLNDEAHHVWDQDSAWNEAVGSLHEAVRKRTGAGLVAQLDFSATPKNNKGQIFRQVVCDTPLGEAVDAGIIKTPVIGRTGQLIEQPHDDASYMYESHLRLGYERWKRSREEWEKSGKKPLLFVMCTDTGAADQIATRLNSDSVFADLNGKTINLHTNLKGRIKKKKVGGQEIEVFEESEKDIKDEDLKALRRISRELDSSESPYACIVSVLMLREGWDVKNVTTIVPLRPYSSKANILPEQTLGRGLRRITPPGQADELVTVVEHPAFSSLYAQELAQEGLITDAVDLKDVKPSTISIFPDDKKDFDALEIALPVLSGAHSIQPVLEGVTIKEIRDSFAGYRPLPLGSKGAEDVKYEGRHLITNEVVEEMKVHLPLLQSGLTAISYYIRELEAACKVQSTHPVLAPLFETFLSEMLFGEKVGLTDERLTSRLADIDVREHIRAVFVPVIREKTVETKRRKEQGGRVLLSNWRPYQATLSERKPAEKAAGTLFNLVPCDSRLEVAMSAFLNHAPDVKAFAKNAGPQALRIDYLTLDQRLSFYRPDFFARLDGGEYAMIETKGRQDLNVPLKAGAAVEWCKTASESGAAWRYVFVPENIMSELTGNQFSDMARSCEPALNNLLKGATAAPELPFFGDQDGDAAAKFYPEGALDKLPPRARKAADDALELFRFLENKGDDRNFAPVFNALFGPLESACKAVIVRQLRNHVPAERAAQEDWFKPDFGQADPRTRRHYQETARKLRNGLVHGSFVSVIGLLRSCLDIAVGEDTGLGGVFAAVREEFNFPGAGTLLEQVTAVNDFRNTYVAHGEQELTDKAMAEENLKHWVSTLARLTG